MRGPIIEPRTQVHPRRPGHLGNLDITSPQYLGYKSFILFITSDTSDILAAMTRRSNRASANAATVLASFLLILTTVSFLFLQDGLLSHLFFIPSTAKTAARAVPINDAMRSFLDRNREYHVLSLDDVSKGWRRDFESGSNKFQPIALGDANHDGVSDTCAVLVSISHKYGVACFPGSDEPVWAVTNYPEEILGVVIDPGMVTPIICYSCDANQPLRWSGSAFESGIRFTLIAPKGGRLLVGTAAILAFLALSPYTFLEGHFVPIFIPVPLIGSAACAVLVWLGQLIVFRLARRKSVSNRRTLIRSNNFSTRSLNF